jgi:hypothetical protein
LALAAGGGEWDAAAAAAGGDLRKMSSSPLILVLAPQVCDTTKATDYAITEYPILCTDEHNKQASLQVLNEREIGIDTPRTA